MLSIYLYITYVLVSYCTVFKTATLISTYLFHYTYHSHDHKLPPDSHTNTNSVEQALLFKTFSFLVPL